MYSPRPLLSHSLIAATTATDTNRVVERATSEERSSPPPPSSESTEELQCDTIFPTPLSSSQDLTTIRGSLAEDVRLSSHESLQVKLGLAGVHDE